MSKKPSEARVLRLEEYLRNHPYGINNDHIADTAFYSYRHANRLFSAKNGESIKSFINRIRLQKAAEYLSYSSKSIFEIAVAVGYESSASLSKMFKKSYGKSPTDYRETYKKVITLKPINVPLFSVDEFDHKDIYAKKVIFDLNMSFNEFYLLIKNTYEAMELVKKDFMILWDEDPETNNLQSSRCFIIVKDHHASEVGDFPPTTEGKYAHFNTSLFQSFDMEDWHKIAFHVLETEEIQMRESTYVEHFCSESLRCLETFIPYRISTAIE